MEYLLFVRRIAGFAQACPAGSQHPSNRMRAARPLDSKRASAISATSDLIRYGGGVGAKAFCSAYLRHPGFRYTFYLRKVAACKDRRTPAYLFYKICLNHYKFRYGLDISATTSIGPGLYIGHFGGVVISPFAVIGSNVNIAQGVTIGAASRGRHKGAPTLEDRVWVGANAIVVGKVTVGRDALIAPGAYVNFDVPVHSIVVGNPGQIVSDKGSEGYINHIYEARP
jgi:serine O-acetyltransferase